MRVRLAILAVVFVAASVRGEEARRVVDLGHPLAESDPSWSGQKVFSRKETGQAGASMGTFSSDEHFGTHLDAPAHFGGAWTTEKIPVERLYAVDGTPREDVSPPLEPLLLP